MSLTPTFVPQATKVVEYTPAATDITHGAWCTFYLDTDSTVTFMDKDGNTTTLMSLKAGYHPILVRRITAVTAGKVFLLLHNNLN